MGALVGLDSNTTKSHILPSRTLLLMHIRIITFILTMLGASTMMTANAQPVARPQDGGLGARPAQIPDRSLAIIADD
jgi:hypothetical protein